jgi:hypothetical protein
VSKEKSQFENVTMPTAEEGVVKRNAGPKLPADFSVGQNLEKEKPVSRAESVKSFVPSFRPSADRTAQEEKEKKAQIEREGVNYDLYLLIKDKLAGEFKERLEEAKKGDETAGLMVFDYEYVGKELCKKTKNLSLDQAIRKNPEQYTPQERDLVFIANNLRELFAEQNISNQDYPRLGIFLNHFIHAYFNSTPKKERKDLKLYLPNTKDLDFIGAELSFGELEVVDVGNNFGDGARGNVKLKAKKAKDNAGKWLQDNANLEVEEAGANFGAEASGSAVLMAQEMGFGAGNKMNGLAQIKTKKAGGYFGYGAFGGASLKAAEVGNNAGKRMRGKAIMEIEEAGYNVGEFLWEDAQVIITKKYGSIGGNRRESSQIILPNGQILKSQNLPPAENQDHS